MRWALEHREAGATAPAVLAWYGARALLPNRQQAMVSFAAVELFEPGSGVGTALVFEAAAQTVFVEGWEPGTTAGKSHGLCCLVQ